MGDAASGAAVGVDSEAGRWHPESDDQASRGGGGCGVRQDLVGQGPREDPGDTGPRPKTFPVTDLRLQQVDPPALGSSMPAETGLWRCWALADRSCCSWRSRVSAVLDAPGRSHEFGRQRGTSTRVIYQQVPVRVVRQMRRQFDEFAQIGTRPGQSCTVGSPGRAK